MNAQRIKLNLIPGGVPPIVHVSQYDVGRTLEFALYDGVTAATVESGTAIDIRGTKPDKTGFSYPCTYSGNVVSIATREQMTAVSGSFDCELHLVKDTQDIGTANFILEVEPAALSDKTNISLTEIPVIIDLARRNQQAAETAQLAAETAQSAAETAQAAAEEAETNAFESSVDASNSARAADGSAQSAAASKASAAQSADAASTSSRYATEYASSASASKTAAANSKSDSEAYARGTRNGTAVDSSDETYHNNSKYYAEVAQAAAAGGIIPQGTCAFADLPNIETAHTGDMWNISDDFVTTSDFREGAGIRYGAGSNVYKTSDGKWDVTAGRMIMMQGATANAAGTPGAVAEPTAGQQDHYWTGGAGWKNDTANLTTTYTTEDDDATTAIITSAGGETAISTMESGAKHSRLFNKMSRAFLNIRKLINTVKRIWNSVGATWVSGHAYKVNDMVVYENGHVYKCKAAHTSSASILPTNTTYWTDTTLAAEIVSLNNSLTKLSTSERAVGSDTNGAIIYEKTYELESTSISNVSDRKYCQFTNFTSGMSSIKEINGDFGYIISTGKCMYPIGCNDFDSSTGTFKAAFIAVSKPDNKNAYIVTEPNVTPTKMFANVTVKYTK